MWFCFRLIYIFIKIHQIKLSNNIFTFFYFQIYYFYFFLFNQFLHFNLIDNWIFYYYFLSITRCCLTLKDCQKSFFKLVLFCYFIYFSFYRFTLSPGIFFFFLIISFVSLLYSLYIKRIKLSCFSRALLQRCHCVKIGFTSKIFI